MLVGSAKPVIEQRGVDYPFDRMRSIIQAAYLAIGNLEMPLGLTGASIPEKDFTFIGEPKLAKGIAKAGFDVLALANNHMGDYGADALLETLTTTRCNFSRERYRATRHGRRLMRFGRFHGSGGQRLLQRRILEL